MDIENKKKEEVSEKESPCIECAVKALLRDNKKEEKCKLAVDGSCIKWGKYKSIKSEIVEDKTFEKTPDEIKEDKKDVVEFLDNLIKDVSDELTKPKVSLKEALKKPLEDDDDDYSRWSAEGRRRHVKRTISSNLVIKIDDGSTKGQIQFVEDTVDWCKSGCPSGEFVLTGPAGTGKTTAAIKLVNVLQKEKLSVQAASFTGKAVSVLKEKGFAGPKTLHSYSYRPKFMRDPKTNKDKVVWEKLPRDEMVDDILLIDEYSMVSPQLLADVRSYGIPIIFTGDDEQLPPVKSDDNGIAAKTNVRLTEVVRQAMLNPIIKWATMIRLGEDFPNYDIYEKNEYGLFATIRRNNEYLDEIMRQYEQTLCGTNKNRIFLNQKMRTMLGYHSDIPMVGEKLICLRNNKEVSVYNGQIVTVKERNKTYDDAFDFYGLIQADDEFTIDAQMFKKTFIDPTFKVEDFRNSQTDPERLLMDFAYAITVHKCITGDTIIFTDKGIKKLKDLDNGAREGEFKNFEEDIKVFNGEEYVKPIAFYNDGVSDCLKITTHNNYSVTSTLNHKNLVLCKSGVIIEKETREINIGDCLLIPKIISDNLNIPILESEHIKEHALSRYWKIPNKMDKNLAEFLGLIVADGVLRTREIRLAKRHKDVVERFSELAFEIFGYECEIKEKKNFWQASIHSVQISRFISNFKGTGANDKYIPEEIMSSSKDITTCFMKGIFEDGSVNLSECGVDHIEFTTKYEKLCEQLRMLLLYNGILSQKFIDKKNMYRIFLYNKNITIFSEISGFISEFKNSRLRKHTPEPTFEFGRKSYVSLFNFIKNNTDATSERPTNNSERNVFNRSSCTIYMANKYADSRPKNKNIQELKSLLNNYFLEEVVSISRETHHTYCLEMPGNHMFVQNGFLLKNSQGSEFDSVMMYDDGSWMKENFRRWRYTGLTRAKKKLVLVKDR